MTLGATINNKPARVYSTPPHNAHRARILYDATIQFCAQQGRKKIEGTEEYKTLFNSFIKDVDHRTKKLISSHLARNRATPRSIAYYLALETIEIAAPFLLMSQVFWERDIMQMMHKLSNSHLLIIARRSDITPAIAGVLMARGDNLINQVLSKNPTLRLNHVAQGKNITPTYQFEAEEPDRQTPAEMPQKPVNELLELAQLAFKGKRKQNNNGGEKPPNRQSPIVVRMLAHANLRNRVMVARELADHIGMSFEKVEKIVYHENCESLVLFLKGINFSQNEAAQLLKNLHNNVADNPALLERFMGLYNRFSTSQCRDVMKNLGAKNLLNTPAHQPQAPDQPTLNQAVAARQRQITQHQGPTLFGTERRSA